MRNPAHRTKGATAPVLRRAEQGVWAGCKALPTAPKVQQLPSFAERSREPGRRRSPAHRTKGATAPVLREAEQGAGQGAKPCPPHQRCNSSRPSRSGAGSLGRMRSPAHRTKGATAPVLREAEQGARAGGEALHVMVPLELGRDRRCQAADPATSAPTPPVT
ncbi:hypothetical protein MKY42_10915 [Paenibacillus sp. FSL W7-1088]|uniref:hypothetical protein n=1 Tax=Paenibacillus sp. FSL W7-1088 TaxID=2921695 RepID=UPI0030EE5832